MKGHSPYLLETVARGVDEVCVGSGVEEGGSVHFWTYWQGDDTQRRHRVGTWEERGEAGWSKVGHVCMDRDR